jgi:hypothetical protein
MNFLDNLADESKALTFVEQNTPEWYQIRLGRFTSSEIWKLIVEPKSKADQEAGKLSETAMTYVAEKVAEVMTGQAKQQGYAFPLVWGIEKEPEAVEYFEKVTGLETTSVGFYPYSDEAGGSPDREIGENEILEIKCPYDSAKQLQYLMLTDWNDLKRDFREYYWQCQANMLFASKMICHFVTFDPRMIEDKHKMTHLIIPANEEDQNLLVKKLQIAFTEKRKLLNLLK